MKKLIIVLLTITALGSCTKKIDCKCGVVTDDDVEIDANFNPHFTLTIQNDCSKNRQKFYMSQGTWMDNPVGDNICIDQVW